MSHFSQEIAAHHPFFVSSVTTDSSFQVTVSILVLRKKWRKRVRRSIAAVTLVFDLHLVGFVGYGCGDAAHGDAGDSGVGVAVQVGIAELLVLFFGGFLYGGVGGKFIF